MLKNVFFWFVCLVSVRCNVDSSQLPFFQFDSRRLKNVEKLRSPQGTLASLLLGAAPSFHLSSRPSRPRSNIDRARAPYAAIAERVPASSVSELEEQAAVEAASAMISAELELPPEYASGPVSSTFIATAQTKNSDSPPIVLLHSFDSSSLEWRRVIPILNSAGLEAYAIDILGWGFTDTRSVYSVGVQAKREHVYAFWSQHLERRPAVFVGSSLGAALIIDLISEFPEAVHSTILLDPQGFIDGTPPVPEWGARAGVRFLRSWPLRWFGQIVAYFDQPRCNTDDAIRVGRLHCARDLWEENQIEWLLGGGYVVSHLVKNLAKAPCLILWGRQDKVLPPVEYVPKFLAALPDVSFRWVEQCGHVPHLEQPGVTAAAIVAFLNGEEVQGDSNASVISTI